MQQEEQGEPTEAPLHSSKGSPCLSWSRAWGTRHPPESLQEEEAPESPPESLQDSPRGRKVGLSTSFFGYWLLKQ